MHPHVAATAVLDGIGHGAYDLLVLMGVAGEAAKTTQNRFLLGLGLS